MYSEFYQYILVYIICVQCIQYIIYVKYPSMTVYICILNHFVIHFCHELTHPPLFGDVDEYSFFFQQRIEIASKFSRNTFRTMCSDKIQSYKPWTDTRTVAMS